MGLKLNELGGFFFFRSFEIGLLLVEERWGEKEGERWLKARHAADDVAQTQTGIKILGCGLTMLKVGRSQTVQQCRPGQ